MPSTPEYSLRYPSLADAPNGPDAVQDLAEDVESTLQTISPVSAATINAKGDLLVGTANDALTRLAVGSNGEMLTADSGQPTGLSWSPPVIPVASETLVTATETTTSDTWTDLATAGPAVTITVGDTGVAVVTLSAAIRCGVSADLDVVEGELSFAMSGANTQAAGVSNRSASLSFDALALTADISLRIGSTVAEQYIVTGLTPGSTTFTMKYQVTILDAPTATVYFATRRLGVVTF